MDKIYSNKYYKVLGYIQKDGLLHGRIIESKTDYYYVGQVVKFPIISWGKNEGYNFMTNNQQRKYKILKINQLGK